MKNQKLRKLALIGGAFSRWLLLLLSLLVFLFALFSGAEEFGGGVSSIVKNSPNALPWIFLLIINWFIWKYELTGSIFLAIFATAAGFFFDAFKDNSSVLYIIILPLYFCSVLLVFSHLAKKQAAL